MKLQEGSTILETLIASTLFTILMVGFLTSLSSLGLSEINSRHRANAARLAQSAIETTYNLSTHNWENFVTKNGSYTLEETFDGTFVLSTGIEDLGDYSRAITISDVYRNAEGAVVETGGNLDENSKKITVTVSWNRGLFSDQLTHTLYVTNFKTI